MTHRYVLLWNTPPMLSADEDERWVERELEQLRASTPSLDMTCVPTLGDDGPGWMLEISIADGDADTVRAKIRDFGRELHSLRLRPRSFVAGPNS